MKVLLVEDETRISDFVKKGLGEAGFDVTVSGNGDEGYELAMHQPFDVIVLDIMLPGRDGLSILRQLRERRKTVPVVLLTARSALDERIEGLDDDVERLPREIGEVGHLGQTEHAEEQVHQSDETTEARQHLADVRGLLPYVSAGAGNDRHEPRVAPASDSESP